MDRIVTRRNLFLFIVYSAAICGCLALMNDFGTALIFFVAFLVIAFLRSGSFATVTLACAATRALQAFWPFASGRISAPLCNMGPCVGICLAGGDHRRAR